MYNTPKTEAELTILQQRFAAAYERGNSTGKWGAWYKLWNEVYGKK